MHQTNTKSDRLGQSERSTSKARDTQQRILAAAAGLFGSRGFDGTGLRQIEDASGVNRGLVGSEVQKMHGIDVFEDAFFQRHIDLFIEPFKSNDFHSRLGKPTRRSTGSKKLEK